MEKVPTEMQEAIPKGEAAAQAAKLVGASTTRIYEMKRIQKDAPEKVEAIRKGELQHRPPLETEAVFCGRKWGESGERESR